MRRRVKCNPTCYLQHVLFKYLIFQYAWSCGAVPYTNLEDERRTRPQCTPQTWYGVPAFFVLFPVFEVAMKLTQQSKVKPQIKACCQKWPSQNLVVRNGLARSLFSEMAQPEACSQKWSSQKLVVKNDLARSLFSEMPSQELVLKKGLARSLLSEMAQPEACFQKWPSQKLVVRNGLDRSLFSEMAQPEACSQKWPSQKLVFRNDLARSLLSGMTQP